MTQKWLRPEGDFFPGIVALALAVWAAILVRRPPPALERAEVSTRRGRAARALDFLALLLVILWLAARLRPEFKLGPLSIGDPGRVQVFLTAVVFARLVFAFPGNGRFASLPDWLRRTRLPPRLVLLLAVAAAGVLIALGANTP